jgi:hypothetical protein
MVITKTRLFLGLSMAAMLLGVPAAAAQDLWGSRSLGMGGTLRAAPSAETALLLNPAGLTLNRNYVINGLYQYRGSDSGSLMNVSIADSVTKTLAAGLFYSYTHASPRRSLATTTAPPFELEETRQSHEVGLAMAYPIGDMFHLGLTGKYVDLGVEQPEFTPASAVDDGTSGFTMDFGGIIRLGSSLNLAVVLQNAIPLDHHDYPMQLGMGAAYALGTFFLAEFDAVLDFDSAEEVKASYHGGGELFLGKRYALRGGAMHDTVRQPTYVTGGLGLVAQRMGLDFGLRQMVEGGAETMVAFSIRLFIQ